MLKKGEKRVPPLVRVYVIDGTLKTMLKKWHQYLALEEFPNTSFPILLNAFIAFS